MSFERTRLTAQRSAMWNPIRPDLKHAAAGSLIPVAAVASGKIDRGREHAVGERSAVCRGVLDDSDSTVNGSNTGPHRTSGAFPVPSRSECVIVAAATRCIVCAVSSRLASQGARRRCATERGERLGAGIGTARGVAHLALLLDKSSRDHVGGAGQPGRRAEKQAQPFKACSSGLERRWFACLFVAAVQREPIGECDQAEVSGSIAFRDLHESIRLGPFRLTSSTMSRTSLTDRSAETARSCSSS
jgi:hypothetical protein